MPLRFRSALWTLIAFAAFAALMVFVTSASWAGEACPSVDATQAAIASAIAHHGGSSEMLTPVETQQYLDVLNAEPPVTHLDAERLVYLTRPDGLVLLGMVKGTQVCPAGLIGLGLHEKALLAARGHGA